MKLIDVVKRMHRGESIGIADFMTGENLAFVEYHSLLRQPIITQAAKDELNNPDWVYKVDVIRFIPKAWQLVVVVDYSGYKEI